MPRNWISVMGRAGTHMPQEGSSMELVVLVAQSKSTGATAAITSAASQASLNDIAPPFEQPVA